MTLDKTTNIDALKNKIEEFVQTRDWEQFHNPKDLAMSISIETAELMELFQWKSKEEVAEIVQKPEKMEEIRKELADIIIYCISMANRLNIDLSEAILKKLEHNNGKYPVEKVKGSAKKYSEI